MIPKDGTLETVEQFIEALQKCNPKAKVSVREPAVVMVVEEPGGKQVYLDVVPK